MRRIRSCILSQRLSKVNPESTRRIGTSAKLKANIGERALRDQSAPEQSRNISLLNSFAGLSPSSKLRNCRSRRNTSTKNQCLYCLFEVKKRGVYPNKKALRDETSGLSGAEFADCVNHRRDHFISSESFRLHPISTAIEWMVGQTPKQW